MNSSFNSALNCTLQCLILVTMVEFLTSEIVLKEYSAFIKTEAVELGMFLKSLIRDANNRNHQTGTMSIWVLF